MMKMTRSLSLALSVALVGTALGCASTAPNANTPAPAAIPQASSITEGSVHPDQFMQSDRQIMVNGQAMSFDQIRKNLPSRISEADAAKLLVEIDTSKIKDGDMEVQQRFGRGFARGFSRGWGRGFYGGFGRGLGYGGYGRFRYLGYGGSYWPYYGYGGYYYPYSYGYGGLSYWPYLYGYGGGYYPYSYCY